MTKLLALCAVLCVLVTACGGGNSDDGSGPAPEAPSPTQASGSPDSEDPDAGGEPASQDAADGTQPGDDTAADQPSDASSSPETSDDAAAGEPGTSDDAAGETPEAYDPILQPSCGGEGELTATAHGVTAETIKIGAPEIDFEELGNLGLAQILRGGIGTVLEVLAEELNENGGICGRMVEVVNFKYLPFGTDTSLAACVYFTEDEEVFAVLGEFTRVPAGNLCVTETHSTALIAAPYTAEDHARANAPWLHMGIASDRRLEVFVTALDKAGLLADAGNVAVHSDAVRQERVDNFLVPALEAAGVSIVERTVLDVPPGDTQAGAAVWRTFQEIYRSADIDTLFVEGDSSSVEQLIQSGLDIALFTTDTEPMAFALEESSDPSYFDAYTLGGPFVEGSTNQRMDDCIEIFERRSGVDVVPTHLLPEEESDWFTPVSFGCAAFDLFVQVAAAAGPNLTNETLQAAIDGFGAIELPNQAFASLGPDKYDVQDGIVLLKFDHEAEDGDGGFVIASDLIDTAG